MESASRLGGASMRCSHEQTCGNATVDRIKLPEHLLASVKGLNSVIAGRVTLLRGRK